MLQPTRPKRRGGGPDRSMDPNRERNLQNTAISTRISCLGSWSPTTRLSRFWDNRPASRVQSRDEVELSTKLSYTIFNFFLLLSRFSFTLNFTILLTRDNGNGLSKGNLTVPVDTSYCDNSLLNALIPEEVGKNPT